MIDLKKQLLDQGHTNAVEAVLPRKPASELEDLRAEKEAIQVELRELRRQLWKAKEGSDEASSDCDSLKDELAKTKEGLEPRIMELRDLRKELWKAKEAAGEADDVRVRLIQTKATLSAYARKLQQADKPHKLVPLRVLLDKTWQKNLVLVSESQTWKKKCNVWQTT